MIKSSNLEQRSIVFKLKFFMDEEIMSDDLGEMGDKLEVEEEKEDEEESTDDDLIEDAG